MLGYYLCAKVDKIQSFIFRSARLKEVVGANQLLQDFYRNVPQVINVTAQNVLSSRGGNLHFKFSSKNDAHTAAMVLRRCFDARIDGVIYIADPFPVTDNLETDRKTRDRLIKEAESKQNSPSAHGHMPFQALCASCGIQPAAHYETTYLDEAPRYLCSICYQKQSVAQSIHQVPFGTEISLFSRLLEKLPDGVYLHQQAFEADTYGESDSRRYVAYLVADGNKMGEFYEAVDLNRQEALADDVQEAVYGALADAIQPIIPVRHGRGILPVLPLLIGGDDLGILMPAPHAFAITEKFCQSYEDRLNQSDLVKKVLRQVNVKREEKNLPLLEKATISAAVVICKASYPYQTAYRYAEENLHLLKDSMKVPATVFSIEMIMGSDAIQSGVRTPLRVYSPNEDYSLLGAKRKLETEDFPNTRRERLRCALYDFMMDTPEWFMADFRNSAAYTNLRPDDQKQLDKILKRLQGDLEDLYDVRNLCTCYDLVNLWRYLDA